MPSDLPNFRRPQQQIPNIKVVNVGPQVNPINFVDGLALLLIGLKLTDHLQDWTWVEVLVPIWAPFMLSWFIRLVTETFFDNENDEDFDDEEDHNVR